VRVIVGGVGYRNLRDHSVGLAVTDGLELPDVVVEDLSYNPIAVVQRLDDEPPGHRFARIVLVGAVSRGRPPGTVTAYRWDGRLPPEGEIHRAVTEAVTGVIALDNTLVIARHFGALPDDVTVVEVEPELEEFGDELGPAVAQAFARVRDMVARLATDMTAAADLPRLPLGGVAAAEVATP
jgi:hydrogenase maturation protease